MAEGDVAGDAHEQDVLGLGAARVRELAWVDRLHAQRARIRQQAVVDAMLRAFSGTLLEERGVPILHDDAEREAVVVSWAGLPNRLRVTAQAVTPEILDEGVWRHDAALPAGWCTRIQLAAGLSPTAAEAILDPEASALAAVPRVFSRVVLGSIVAGVTRTPRNTLVTWRHLHGTSTSMLVCCRGVAFGPFAGPGVQYDSVSPWAVALMVVFGYRRAETPAEAELRSTLLARGAGARARITEAEWAFFVKVVDLIDPALLMSPSLMTLFCDAMRRLEVSERIEGLINSRAVYRGVRLWYPALDIHRVRRGEGAVQGLYWLAGRRLAATRADAMFLALPSLAAVRADVGEAGMLPSSTWRDFTVTATDMVLTAASETEKRALLSQRPQECLVRQLFWTTSEHTAFIDAGGQYHLIEGSVVPDDVLGRLLGLPYDTPDAEAPGLTAAQLATRYETFILSAPMGARKSTAIVNFLRHCVKLDAFTLDAAAHRVVVQITPRRALAAHAAGALHRSGLHFHYYGSSGGDLSSNHRLVVQAESLHRVVAEDGALADPHILLLDEASMVLMQFCSVATHGKNHQANVAAFIRMVQRAAIVIVADAFMTPAVFRFLAFLRGGRETDPSLAAHRFPGAHFIEVPALPAAGTMRRVDSLETLTHHITRCVGGGRVDGGVFKTARVACCIASASAASKLADWLSGYNDPDNSLWFDRRCVLLAYAEAHGFDAAWAEASLRPIRVSLFMGGDSEGADLLKNVEEEWGPTKADVVIFTTTAACGVSYVGAGDSMFDAVFFYGCAGSDVCRVQGQMVRRVRHSRSNLLTYCLEGRSDGRPAAVGRPALSTHVAERGELVSRLLSDAEITVRAPAFLRAMIVEHENEVAICRLWFTDIMVRYLELAGFTAVDEAMEEGGARLAPDFNHDLVAFEDVGMPVGVAALPLSERVRLLELYRQRLRRGFRLRYDQQLWVTKADLIARVGEGAETPYVWAVAVDPRSGLFRQGFHFQTLTMYEVAATTVLAATASGSYVEAVPARFLWPTALTKLADAISDDAVRGPSTLLVAKFTLDNATLVSLYHALTGSPARLRDIRTSFGLLSDSELSQRGLTDLIKRAFHTAMGGRVTVMQGSTRRVPAALAGTVRRRAVLNADDDIENPRSRVQVRERSIDVDLRPWWRLRTLLRRHATAGLGGLATTSHGTGTETAAAETAAAAAAAATAVAEGEEDIVGDPREWWETVLVDWGIRLQRRAPGHTDAEAPVITETHADPTTPSQTGLNDSLDPFTQL